MQKERYGHEKQGICSDRLSGSARDGRARWGIPIWRQGHPDRIDHWDELDNIDEFIIDTDHLDEHDNRHVIIELDHEFVEQLQGWHIHRFDEL